MHWVQGSETPWTGHQSITNLTQTLKQIHTHGQFRVLGSLDLQFKMSPQTKQYAKT